MSVTSAQWLSRKRGGAHAQTEAAPPLRVTCDALVLLAGVVRPTEWHRAIGRPLLELPVDQDQSLLDAWVAQAVGVARAFAPAGLPVRVRLDHGSPVPGPNHVRHSLARVSIERDTGPWRGSGGVLRDVAAELPDNARIAAVHAAQVPLQSLRSVVADLAEAGADAALAIPIRGTCGSAALLRCGCLRGLPDVGYCDLYEQALPIISKRFVTRAVRRPAPVGAPVRSRAAYVQALRQYHRTRQGVAFGGPMAEDWKPAFGIVEQGASVHPTAQVLDSVVLRGARVGRGAVLVRSVVCPEGVVRPGRVLVDQLVSSSR